MLIIVFITTRSWDFRLNEHELNSKFQEMTLILSDYKTSVIMQRCKFDPGRPSISFPKGKTNKFEVSCSQVEVEESLSDEACELVNGTELIIGEGDESISAHLFQAVKNNNATGILLLSDIYGFEESSTKDFAYRVACNGYKYV